MASPTYLGNIGSASDDSGSVTSLDLVITKNVPPDPAGSVVLYVVGAPTDQSGHLTSDVWVGGNPLTTITDITDDQPDPGGTGRAGNEYSTYGTLVNGALVYNFGIGLFPINSFFNVRSSVSGAAFGALITAVRVRPLWGLTIGTTITIVLPPGIDNGPWQYAAAQAFAYTKVNFGSGGQPVFMSRTLNPANTGDASNLHTPLSSVKFSDLHDFGEDVAGNQLLAVVVANTADGVISDPSGNWTPRTVDTSVGCAFSWAVYSADGASVDVTESVCQFLAGGAATATFPGLGIVALPIGSAAPVGHPAFNRLIPV